MRPDEECVPLRRRRTEVSGWGRSRPTAADIVSPLGEAGLRAVFGDPSGRGMLARGLGRSYGDAAQNSGGVMVDLSGDGGVEFDPSTGICRAGAGVSLDHLMRYLVPQGWFVPVTPGTRFVTVGGAVAADVHGKDHHRRGSFGSHVESLVLWTPGSEPRTLGPHDDPDAFWATIGGMGLTGVMSEVSFRCLPIPSSWIWCRTERARDLSTVLGRLAELDAEAEYTVAWLDLSSGGGGGRGVITSGRWAAADEVGGRDRFAFTSPPPVPVPLTAPRGSLNRWTVRAFNELWFRKAPRRPTEGPLGIGTFFHPLDLFSGWNRLYGVGGFLQWQCVVPDEAEDVLADIIEAFGSTGGRSFLTVLKRLGPGNEGHLSFPMKGWTLAVDVPLGDLSLSAMLDEMDRRVADAGGRVYLAKDARMRREVLAEMYPRLEEWREIRDRLDPGRMMRSDLARRMGWV